MRETREDGSKHLPLRLVGDGRIETADGWAVGLNWFTSGPEPYAAAHEFAPYIVRAVNCHAELVAVLEEMLRRERRRYGDTPRSQAFYERANAKAFAALSRSKSED